MMASTGFFATALVALASVAEAPLVSTTGATEPSACSSNPIQSRTVSALIVHDFLPYATRTSSIMRRARTRAMATASSSMAGAIGTVSTSRATSGGASVPVTAATAAAATGPGSTDRPARAVVVTGPTGRIAIVASTGSRSSGPSAAVTAATSAVSSKTTRGSMTAPSSAWRSWANARSGRPPTRPLAIASSTSASTSGRRPKSA